MSWDTGESDIHFGGGKETIANDRHFVQFGINTDVTANQIIDIIQILGISDAGGPFSAFFCRLENQFDGSSELFGIVMNPMGNS